MPFNDNFDSFCINDFVNKNTMIMNKINITYEIGTLLTLKHRIKQQQNS